MLSVWISHEYNKKQTIKKVFVSSVKFTKVHVRGFVNEPTICHQTERLRVNLDLQQADLGLSCLHKCQCAA